MTSVQVVKASQVGPTAGSATPKLLKSTDLRRPQLISQDSPLVVVVGGYHFNANMLGGSLGPRLNKHGQVTEMLYPTRPSTLVMVSGYGLDISICCGYFVHIFPKFWWLKPPLIFRQV